MKFEKVHKLLRIRANRKNFPLPNGSEMKRGGGSEKSRNFQKHCVFSRKNYDQKFSRNIHDQNFFRKIHDQKISRKIHDQKITRKIHDQKFSEKITPKNFLEKNHDQTFSRKNHDLSKFFQFSSFHFFSISPRNEKGGARENFFVLHVSLKSILKNKP